MLDAIVTIEGKNGLVKDEVDRIIQRKAQRITVIQFERSDGQTLLALLHNDKVIEYRCRIPSIVRER
jgi:hypothetical protein